MTRTRRSTFPARPTTSVSCTPSRPLECSLPTRPSYLEPLQHEVEEVRDDGEQVDQVEAALGGGHS